MKAKILMIAVLLGISAILVAQPIENEAMKSFRRQGKPMFMGGEPGNPVNGLNLTDAQKEAFKKSMFDLQKQLQPLRNELGEARAHLKTLATVEKPDLAVINKSIEKIGAIRVEMAKIQTKQHLEMRAQLTDEQRLKFDLFNGKMRQGRGQNAMKRGRAFQR